MAVSTCNVTRGMVCLQSGLYRHILCMPNAEKSLKEAFKIARAEVELVKTTSADPDGAYWIHCKIPKMLVNVMESQI
ncbi:hypothetical protein BGZ99_006319 [Dissophora globulifera]|uniref:Uncharacterized protein n=1 Tax=Dissophora globulifera TaxID=979702 RepID=A0A9P6USJ4_9FUNG|nr:hypothetical protein BGZ99_006319 [Dissophora globulifera]